MMAAASEKNDDVSVALLLNGASVSFTCQSSVSLAEVLREEIGLSGTKIGCNAGECGACTVMVNGEAICSCIYPAIRARGSEVLTIEGVEKEDGTLSPLQDALYEQGAFQCGYCAPGMVMSLTALFEKNANPSETEIRCAIQGNVCRCSGYVRILRAASSLAMQGTT